MRFVHTFWSEPLFKNKFNNYNTSLLIILLNYAYSFGCLKNMGESIVLFTDVKGKDVLSFIPYDDVYIIEDLPTDSEFFAAQLKFKALENCALNDVLIDGDLFIQKPESLKIIKESKVDCLYSFFEPATYILNQDLHLIVSLLSNLYKIQYQEPYGLPQKPRDIGWYNTSLLKISNSELKKEYINLYYYHQQKLLNCKEVTLSDTDWPDIYFELYFLTRLCKFKNYTSAPVIENYTTKEANDYALNIGFTHLGSSKWQMIDYIETKLNLLNNSLFELYKKQYELWKR